MRLPRPDTRAMRVLRVLIAQDAITVEQGMELHGRWKAKRCEIERIYQKLVADGCAVLTPDGRYSATRQACESLLPAPVPSGTPAAPATRRHFLAAPPYDPKRHGMSSRGLRPGSNDWRSWPSLYPSTHPKEHP